MGDVLSLVDGPTNRANDNKEMAEKLRHLATFVERCETPVEMGILLLAVKGYIARYPFGANFNKAMSIGILSIAQHEAMHDHNHDVLDLIRP